MTSKDKNPVGRPLKYKTAEELQKKIDEYFDYCDNRIQHVYSKKSDGVIEIINPAPYTMSGLALAMGMDRRTLLDYSKRDEFLPTIKAAREKVHQDVETRLMENNATGAIFNLKNNFDWKDKTEIEATIDDPRKQILDKYLGGEDAGQASQAEEKPSSDSA